MARLLQYAALLAVIFGCVRYAVAREAVHDANLHAIYTEINRTSFAGSLPDVDVEWSDLANAYGEISEQDGEFRIEIDRRSVTMPAQLRDVLHHEACHVATVEQLHGEDLHGPMFERCMMRFEADWRRDGT